MKIKHQKQPTDTSCVHTCLAMALDVDVTEVMAFADRHHLFCGGMSTCETLAFLMECRMIHTQLSRNAFTVDGLYLLTVPSLNIEGGKHAVLVRAEDFKEEEIWDPNRGRKGKKYYVPYGTARGPLQVELNGFTEPIYLVPGGRLPVLQSVELLKDAEYQLKKTLLGQIDRAQIKELLREIDKYLRS